MSGQLGLIERIESGRASGRPSEALSNPDPNNCIFILIDRVETGKFNEEVDQTTSRVTWINENRYLVLDGWIKENLPDIFAACAFSRYARIKGSGTPDTH